MDQEPPPNKQIAGDRLLKRLGIDPNKWTVGDRRIALLGLAIGLLIVIIAVCGYVFGWAWTGLTKPQRTFWDWLSLLIVPIVLALGGYLFNRSESRRTKEDAERQRTVDRQIADQRAQDEALEAYLDQIGQLLLDKDGPLRQSKEDSEARTLARAQTLTVLRRLDSERKGRVLQFLYESGLIARGRPVLDLRGADLSGANLFRTDLREIDLGRANLLAAILIEANLGGANLGDVNLREAHLDKVNLREANLGGANLRKADLSGANLSGANLSEANLREAYVNVWLVGSRAVGRLAVGRVDLSGADLSDADLSLAKLSWTNLGGANLFKAVLFKADLHCADLHCADLSDARLDGADLSDAKVTQEQLSQCKSLEGATMPNGQILQGNEVPDGPTFEAWLKDKDSRKEDAENE